MARVLPDRDEASAHETKPVGSALIEIPWCSGYHICLTRRRSPVRSWAESLFCPRRPAAELPVGGSQSTFERLSTRPWEVAWPSGLRRWFKAPVSSEAWVRIPPLPHFAKHASRIRWRRGSGQGSKRTTVTGLEPAIFGSEVRRLIH